MIGDLLTRTLALILGYAYPAYECFKTVELNKPDIEQLIFWCQYWILVAVLTVFERVGDNFISWLPMYSEAKVAFFVYLWYPKTKGTSYVYETFFRPYMAKHENEIDRNLLELRTRAGDIVVLYFQKFASYGQTRFLEILQYVASQSPSQSSRQQPTQRQPQPPIRRTTSAVASKQQLNDKQPQRSTTMPSNQSKSLPEEPTKQVVPTPPASPVAQLRTSTSLPTQPSSGAPSLPEANTEGEVVNVATENSAKNEDPNPPPEETHMEEAIRVTRGRLRKRASNAGALTR